MIAWSGDPLMPKKTNTKRFNQNPNLTYDEPAQPAPKITKKTYTEYQTVQKIVAQMQGWESVLSGKGDQAEFRTLTNEDKQHLEQLSNTGKALQDADAPPAQLKNWAKETLDTLKREFPGAEGWISMAYSSAMERKHSKFRATPSDDGMSL